MLKPIKTVRLKTVGLGVRFARKITQRAAVLGSCDLSENELVFAMSAARERDDLMTVLELLDEVLDLIRRGFDRHTAPLSMRIINNIGIILSRGGFSKEYFTALQIYNKISSAVTGKGNTENFNYSECRTEIQNTLSVLRSEQSGKNRGNVTAFDRAKTLNTFKKVSERETVTLNTLNSGVFKITARNPELLKMIKTDKIFTELSLKNIGNIRRRAERGLSVRRFLEVLTKDQAELLERFISEDRNLFPELRTAGIGKQYDLKYLLENSSGKSLSEFFGTIRKTLEEHHETLMRGRVSEKNVQKSESYFDSVEQMREFFSGAKKFEIERLIKELNKNSLYRKEADTLTEALRVYGVNEINSEKRRTAEEKSAELFRIAEAALKRKLREENFSGERFIAELESSHELKKIFADYAWENYRSEDTLKRFAEFTDDELTISAEDLFDTPNRTVVLRGNAPGSSENTVSSVDSVTGTREKPEFPVSGNSVISGSGGRLTAGETAKEKFADFFIRSGEINLKFSESVKNSFINASSDVAAAFAEYLVNTVREDSFNYFSEQVRSLAEKAENILYYGGSDLEKQSSETLSLISGSWNECAPQLTELYTGFTQPGGSKNYYFDEIMKLYSYLPKTNYTAVSEFFEAAAQGDAYFIELSKEILSKSAVIPGDLNNSGDPGDFSGEPNGDIEYTFYDALTEISGDISEDPLTLLFPLAGIDNGNFSWNNTEKSSPDNTGGADHAESGGFPLFIDNGYFSGNDTAENPSYYSAGRDILINRITDAFAASTTLFSEYLSGNFTGKESPNTAASTMLFSGYLPGKESPDTAAEIDGINGASEKLGRIKKFSDRLETVLHDERSNNREKSEKALELIHREWRENSGILSKLYAEFKQTQTAGSHSRTYSRNDPERTVNILETEKKTETDSSAVTVGIGIGGFSERVKKLFERSLEAKTVFAGENSQSESVFGREFEHIIKETVSETVKTADQRLIFAEKLSGLTPVLSGVYNRAEFPVYNINTGDHGNFDQAGNNRATHKSIVTDKKFYNALKAFNGGGFYAGNTAADADPDTANSIFSENFYLSYSAPVTGTGEYFFTWENESVTLFNRVSADKIHRITNGFLEKRSSAVLAFSERISEKISEENRRSEYNTAVELFYTDEYFESASNGRTVSGTPMNYALSAAAPDNPDDISEKLGNIREAIGSINAEITQLKQREEEQTREFVTKNEQKVFERELKSSIERDIYLAGKRHGIY